MAKGKELVTRSDLRTRLVVNAATKPVNVLVPAAVVVGGVVIGTPWLFAVAVLVYLALAAQTFFDGEEAARVGQRAYRRVGAPGRAAKPDLGRLTPPVRSRLEAALSEQQAISQTVADADLPFAEVSEEIGALVAALQAVAGRADRLYRYLQTQDTVALERRIAELGRAGPEASDTLAALQKQREGLVQVSKLLRRYDGEMEAVQASLSAVHSRLVRMAVTSEEAGQADLAGDVRELRGRVESLTDALTSAYDRT